MLATLKIGFNRQLCCARRICSRQCNHLATPVGTESRQMNHAPVVATNNAQTDHKVPSCSHADLRCACASNMSPASPARTPLRMKPHRALLVPIFLCISTPWAYRQAVERSLATIRADIGFVIDCESFQFVDRLPVFPRRNNSSCDPPREVPDHGCSDCRYSMPYR